MKIGILGGTFDPPHNAHREIASRALEQFNLKKILFIPTGVSWQKTEITKYTLRYEMTEILIKDNNYFLIAPREGVPNENLRNIFPFEYQIIEGSYLDISSTNVRKIMNSKENLDNYIPHELIEFIKDHSLYSL